MNPVIFLTGSGSPLRGGLLPSTALYASLTADTPIPGIVYPAGPR